MLDFSAFSFPFSSTISFQNMEIDWLFWLEPVSYLWDSKKRIFVIYLLSSALMALIYWRLKHIDMKALFKRTRIFNYLNNPSHGVDIQLLFINFWLRALVVIPLIGTQFGLSFYLVQVLQNQFGAQAPIDIKPQVLALLFTLCFFVVDDFSRFFVHFLYHKVPWLWRFHAIHHSATALSPITLYRIHPLEMLFNSLRSLLVVGTMSGLFVYLFSSAPVLLTILGINAFSLVFNLLGANLRHSHVYIGFGRLEHLFISPAQHQLHHSDKPEHFDLNMGSALAIWDKMFNTWRASKYENVNSFGVRQGLNVKQTLTALSLGLNTKNKS